MKRISDEKIAEKYMNTFAAENINLDNPFELDETGGELDDVLAQALRNIAQTQLDSCEKEAAVAMDIAAHQAYETGLGTGQSWAEKELAARGANKLMESELLTPWEFHDAIDLDVLAYESFRPLLERQAYKAIENQGVSKEAIDKLTVLDDKEIVVIYRGLDVSEDDPDVEVAIIGGRAIAQAQLDDVKRILGG